MGRNVWAMLKICKGVLSSPKWMQAGEDNKGPIGSIASILEKSSHNLGGLSMPCRASSGTCRACCHSPHFISQSSGLNGICGKATDTAHPSILPEIVMKTKKMMRSQRDREVHLVLSREAPLRGKNTQLLSPGHPR